MDVLTKSLGKEMGTITLILLVISALDYFVKIYHQRWKRVCKQYAENRYFMLLDEWLMKIVVRYHKWWGIAGIAAVLLHTGLLMGRFGLVLSGLVPAVLMLLQGIIGYQIGKHYDKKLLTIHRTIAILLAISIGIHLIDAKFYL